MSATPKLDDDDDNKDEETIINWQDEANAIIGDVKCHVAEIVISSLSSDSANIYLNLRTIEGATCCIHASARGFRIVSNQYDTIDDDKKEFNVEDDDDNVEIFETPYALLDRLSPRYVESFGNQLCQQLLKLEQKQTAFNEEDEDELEDSDQNDDDDDDGEEEEEPKGGGDG